MEHELLRGRRLLEELEHLSGSARQQRRRLKQLGGGTVDELALDFDAALAPATMDFPLYPNALAAQLREIDDLLNRMSSPGKRGLWTVYSLVTAPEWRHVRRAASHAADSLRLLLESWQSGKEDENAHCRVCGYEPPEPPWGISGVDPLWESCPCCGVEYGYHDATVAGVLSFRAGWLNAGAQWADPSIPEDGLTTEMRLRRVANPLR